MNLKFSTKYPLLIVGVVMILAILLVVEFSIAVAFVCFGSILAVGVVLELVFRVRLPLILSLFGLASILLTIVALPSSENIAYDVRYDAVGVVESDPSPSKKWDRVAVDLLSIRDSATIWHDNRSKAFLNIDTTQRVNVKRGDTVVFRGFFRQIQGTYGERLFKQGVKGQFYSYKVEVVGPSNTSFVDLVNASRRRAAERIFALDTSSATAAAATATLAAITIGVRSQIPKETIRDYRYSGVAHLLAISGLHIGIVVALLNLLLISIRPWSRAGRYIYSGLIILMLWGYALYSGMSPSVLRAVVMFTLYQVAMMIYRDGVSLNVLSAAAIIMLVGNPLYLYDLGFQLSFVAMAGIAVFYRPISSMWHIENRVLRGIWQAVVVALSAQVAVLPLSVYYFSYLPYLGLPVGLLLWVFIPLMIGSTLIFLVTSWEWVGLFGVKVAQTQNYFLSVVGGSDWVVVDGLEFELWVLLLIYAVMVLGAIYLSAISKKRSRHFVLRSTYNI